MVTSNDLILERLQDIFDRAVNTNARRDFFLSLFEYINVYDEEPVLEEVIKSIIAKGKSEIQKQTELADKALIEMRKVYQEVKDYIKKEKVTNPQTVNNLNQFTALEEGQLTTSDGPIKGRYGYLSYVLMTLAEDESGKHLPFARKYGSITDEHRIQGWHISPSYEQWEQETNWLDRIKLTRTWYSWDRLVYFYSLYRDYEKMIKTKLSDNNVWEAANISGLFGEIKDIIANKKPEQGYIEFQEAEFKTHLQRVHSYTKQALLSNDNILAKNSDHTFKLEGNNLTVDGQTIKFKADKRKIVILSLIVKNTKGIYFSEEETEIEGATGTIKDIKNICYEACRGIENRLAKYGITNFLIFDFNKAKINPIYKKLRI